MGDCEAAGILAKINSMHVPSLLAFVDNVEERRGQCG